MSIMTPPAPPTTSSTRKPAASFTEAYRSLLATLRAALHGLSKPEKAHQTTSGLLTPPTDSMDIDKISHNPATPMSQLPVKLPNSHIGENIDPVPIAQAAIVRLQMLDRSLFTDDTLWRDIFALTGTTRTFGGADRISSTWKELTELHRPHSFKIAPHGGVIIMRPNPALSWINVKFSFQTGGSPNMNCTGVMRVVPGENEDWKIWLLTTILQSVAGFPDVDALEAVMEVDRPLTPVSDAGDDEVQNCVIVGAGMSGLCLAGYMKALGYDAVVLERKNNIGQTWQERYDSVSIHTSRACGQLPFEPVWGPEYPYHLNVNHLVEGYTKWVKKYGLSNDIWLSTELIKAYWNEKESTWTLEIKQRGINRKIRTRHLVFALGLCSLKKMPSFPNRDAYKGQVMHAEDYRRASSWKDLKGVVVGAANSGHDIANDMLKSGLSSVTMVQRGATPVIPVEYYSKIYDGVYNDKIPVHVSDAMMVSTPNAITRLMAQGAVAKMAAQQPERFEALEKQGFKVVHNVDMYHCLLERFGSHYIDVGVSKKIADGLIKVKSDALITAFTEKGLLFSDGTTLEADIVVFATGYEGNMKVLAAPMLEESVADKLHDYWGVDDEGEIRGAWKPIGHPNVWYTGGNVLFMRYFAKFLAMSLAADLKGCPLPVYEKRY